MPLKETFEGLRVYVDRQIKYNKLLLGKKLGELFAHLALSVILGFLATLVLIFLSFAFVWWFSGNGYGETYVGFLLVTLFYALLGFVVFLSRNRLIYGPVRKLLGNVLYEEDDAAHEAIHFSSLTLLNHKIQKSKENLEQQEEILKKHFAGLGEAYTFTSISQRMLKNAYQSVMTTSNVARFTYLLVKRLKGSKKKNPKKKADRLEEENS
ncbi:MAG: hypothetical protein L3J31_02970 [Bacteroidales bacterium]|nr:hypothetical protein [Bacteroidales bacterium]